MTKLDVFPNELKQLNQWICWKSVQRDGEKKPTKVPCNPETGHSIDPSKQLYSYSKVCQYADKYKENISGIGFYFNGNGISGIDLDNCIDDSGNLSSDARKIINKLDSYTEISPSGKGVHILFRGQLSPGSHNKSPNYEVYSDKRFFTMTGNVFEGRSEIKSRQSELEWFVEKYIQPKKLSQSDEIINLIRRSKIADKFNRLINGDISDYDDDDSKADAGLMSILAFFTKKNVLLMEEIFNKSKLAMRDKWKNRQDYRSRTIKYAIENTKEMYVGSYYSENSREIPSLDDQICAANSVLEHFGNPCGSFDTKTLPPIIRQYVDHICTTTDADPIIVTASVIGMISGFLKKSVYIPEDDFKKAPNECYFERLHPNVYFLSVLQSGRFKTTALNKGFRIAYQLQETMKGSCSGNSENQCTSGGIIANQPELDFGKPQRIFLPQKTTGEALLRDLTEYGGGVIVLSELGSWLQEMEKSYNIGLKSLFTHLYDVPATYGVSTKKEGIVDLERPFVSIVGASTIDWVKDNNNVKDVSTGFFARFLIFNPPDKLSNPPSMPVRRPGMDKEIEEEIKNILLTKIPKTPREYFLSMEAFERFNKIHHSLYDRLNQLPDHTRKILEPYVRRWSPYILKIGMIFQFAINPDTSEIGIQAIESAFHVVKYAMQSTTYLFKHQLSESKHQANCRKILEYMASRTRKSQQTTWSNLIGSHILSGGGKEYEVVVKDLMDSKKIDIKNPSAKRGDQIYYLVTGGEKDLECLE